MRWLIVALLLVGGTARAQFGGFPTAPSGVSLSTANTWTALQTFNADVQLVTTTAATSGSQFNGSPVLHLAGNYWNGVASTSFDATIQNIVSGTSPAADLTFLMGGSSVGHFHQNGDFHSGGNLVADGGSITASAFDRVSAGAMSIAAATANAITIGGSNIGTSGITLNSGTGSTTVSGKIVSTGTTFASLGTPANGTLIYCSDCTIATPCASAGTGALAKRLNGVWVCN